MQTRKQVEYFLAIFFGNANTIVGHVELPVLTGILCFKVNDWCDIDCNKLDGIGNQVLQEQLQQRRLPSYGGQFIAGDIGVSMRDN